MTASVSSAATEFPTRRTLLLGAFGAAAAALPAFGQALPAEFPRQPMTLVVPFSAGGPVDVLGRLLAQEYQARSGLAATVENKTGGAGNIGIDAVRKAKPDGATLLLIPAGNLTINPTLMSSLSLDIERDLTPIAVLASAPNVIVASPKLGVTTIGELIAKARSADVSYGSPGVGSQLHLTVELLKEKTGASLLHVPYRGSTQALNDLLGGHIDVLATNLTALLPAIKAGNAVPLAMTGSRRDPILPAVPTLAEAGIDGIDVTSWYGLMGPANLPPGIRDAIYTATRDVLRTPALREKLEAQGLTVLLETPDQFIARLRRETALWAAVIKSRNIVAQ